MGKREREIEGRGGKVAHPKTNLCLNLYIHKSERPLGNLTFNGAVKAGQSFNPTSFVWLAKNKKGLSFVDSV